MAQAIQSFDVFDTLIARRCGSPDDLLKLLEARCILPGLAQARRAADQKLWNLGQPYDLHQLWQEAGRTLGLDFERIQHLYDCEVALEQEQVIPIVENIELVRDGDLLISDTYLPRAVILSLLDRVGFRKQVALVVSNDGKSRGWIWRQILESTPITRHVGDNPHSDGKTPTDAGIPAVIYTASEPSAVETTLSKRGGGRLAQAIREMRLANPFVDTASTERYLWLLTCQLNLPMLIFGSLWLEQQFPESTLLFVSRDGWLWHRLHKKLFPQRKVEYLFASRLCQFHPSSGYRRYFDSVWTPDSVIVDLSSTGASWSRFFAQRQQRGRCGLLCYIDNYRYTTGSHEAKNWLDIQSAMRTSERGAPISKGLEMINYAPYPVVEDVVELPNGVYRPALGDSLDYDRRWPLVAEFAFDQCLDRVPKMEELPRVDSQTLAHWIREFVHSICGDPRLPQIYPSNYSADVAYEERLRAGT